MNHNEKPGMVRRSVRPSILILAVFLTLTACGGSETSSNGKESTGDKGKAGTGGGETTQAVAESVKSYVLLGNEVYPEGVALNEATGEFFVGSTTDGTIFRGVVGGENEAGVLLEPGGDGRETAVGMKVDDLGRLFIAGGNTGRIFIYDAATGDLVRALETPESDMTFINDVALTPNGDAYFTDSMRPTLFRVPSTPDGGGEAEPWLNLEGTPIEYQEGFNLNGIVASEDGRYLVVTQSNTGNLYRIGTESREVTQIDLGGETVAGDGMVLDGGTLYAVRGQDGTIVPVQLSEDFTSGEVGEAFADSSFARPTTIAKYDNRLLVVNSQFDRRESGEGPDLPFTISDIEIP